tara:strand:+ start:180 stop:380 length:201 start_codon:yes stop_codon:yes gene_type:complete
MMAVKNDKPFMRCLGEFVGYIVSAVRSDVRIKEVRKTTEEKHDGNITLRRTTIDEMVIHEQDASNG